MCFLWNISKSSISKIIFWKDERNQRDLSHEEGHCPCVPNASTLLHANYAWTDLLGQSSWSTCQQDFKKNWYTDWKFEKGKAEMWKGTSKLEDVQACFWTSCHTVKQWQQHCHRWSSSSPMGPLSLNSDAEALIWGHVIFSVNIQTTGISLNQ